MKHREKVNDSLLNPSEVVLLPDAADQYVDDHDRDDDVHVEADEQHGELQVRRLPVPDERVLAAAEPGLVAAAVARPGRVLAARVRQQGAVVDREVRHHHLVPAGAVPPAVDRTDRRRRPVVPISRAETRVREESARAKKKKDTWRSTTEAMSKGTGTGTKRQMYWDS